jgi:hypothetical protein
MGFKILYLWHKNKVNVYSCISNISQRDIFTQNLQICIQLFVHTVYFRFVNAGGGEVVTALTYHQ